MSAFDRLLGRLHAVYWRRWPFRGRRSNAVNDWFFARTVDDGETQPPSTVVQPF